MQRPRPLITISRPLLQRLSALMAVLAFVAASVFGLRLVRGSALGERVMAALSGGSARGEEGSLRSSSAVRQNTDDAADPSSGEAAVGASNTPAIRVEKVLLADAAVQVGDEVAYRITVSNPSDIPLTAIRLSDQYDSAFLQYLSADPAPLTVDEDSGILSWEALEVGLDDGSLDYRDSLDIELRFVALSATTDSPARNSASVDANDGTVADGPATVELPIAAQAPPAPARLCLGDLIFVDLADDGRFDPSAGDLGISEVALSLYADTDGDGAWSDADSLLRQTQTDGDGRYGFCDLAEGDYLVVVEAANFAPGGPLGGLRPGGSRITPDPDDDADGDNNGGTMTAVGTLAVDTAAVASGAISLRAGTEPATEIDGGDTDQNGTLDFGFAMREGIGSGSPDPLPMSPPELVAPEEPLYLGKPEQPAPWSPHPGYGKPVHGKPGHEGPGGGGRRP